MSAAAAATVSAAAAAVGASKSPAASPAHHHHHHHHTDDANSNKKQSEPAQELSQSVSAEDVNGWLKRYQVCWLVSLVDRVSIYALCDVMC